MNAAQKMIALAHLGIESSRRGEELTIHGDVTPSDAELEAAYAEAQARPTREDRLAEVRAKAEALPQNNPARAIFLDLIDTV